MGRAGDCGAGQDELRHPLERERHSTSSPYSPIIIRESRSRVPDARSIKLLIQELAAADAPKRERAAQTIYQQGLELARPAVELWMADAEFKCILVFDNPDFPITTVGVAV